MTGSSRVHISETNDATTGHPDEVWQKSSKALLEAYHDPYENHVSFKSTVRRAKEREYVHLQFKRCQEQVGMDPILLFFAEPYEHKYLAFMNKINVPRVRITFTIGGVASGFLFWYEADRLQAYDATVQGFSKTHEIALYVLGFGVIVPTFLIAVALSWLRPVQRNLERLGLAVYWTVAMAFITKKWVQQQTGPILPLVILLIPMFNVTRIRFAYTCVLGCFIVATYFVVQLSFGPDLTSAIVFQTCNYSMSVIAGMVAGYQREILKRRNFTLGLPFQGRIAAFISYVGLGVIADASSLIHDPRYRKELLCHSFSQRFRYPPLEQYFYRYWYLLDGSPYENPKAGILHLNVYLGIKYTTIGVLANQITLSLQDTINLFDTNIICYTLAIRYGIVVPAYGLQYLLFYYYGREYANLWRKQRETQVSDKYAPKSPSSSPGSSPPKTILVHTKAAYEKTRESLKNPAKMAKSLEQVPALFKQQAVHKKGYTQSAQSTTFATFLLHIGLNAFIFFLIAETLGAKSVYFMGFLNSLLSAHRSGFRLRYVHLLHFELTACRFVYSFVVTWCLCLGFITNLHHFVFERFTEYMSYVLVVQVLGMIISYEEENLRRSFFIKKTLRLIEFQDWCETTVLIPLWIRKRLLQKCRAAKARVVALREAPADGTTPDARPLHLRSSLIGLKAAVAHPMQLVATIAMPVARPNMGNIKAAVAHPVQTVSAVLPGKVIDLGRVNLRDLQQHLNKNNKVVSSASANMSRAGRYGVYATSINILIAAGQVIFFLAKRAAA
ncbi:hypothetical protein ACHHYP_03462 [Achlya hypogyna]|uniref:Transmembrane protein n=1 Tax=Achlya hypogyna TaxID=1202772 RepID=A0A1V9Z3Q5_ACHHY|nr:hypothetical protein ACHHYP_03462 [Achlya hypogyna]